jgi:hypothetical protein
MEDGVYEVKVLSSATDQRTGPAWYSRIVVANNEPSLTISVRPETGTTQPISGRVYFRIQSSGTPVALTHATLVIRGEDGTAIDLLALDPGPATRVGWRTASYPNGVYQISAVGEVGDLYRFESDPITVTVRN